jgi:kynurenine aminotransferase
VLVNLSKFKIPDNYKIPSHIVERSRDFKLSWFLINKLGVGAIPPSGESFKFERLLKGRLIDSKTEFYSEKNLHVVEDFLRFGVCRTDERLELAKERLRGLKKCMSP